MIEPPKTIGDCRKIYNAAGLRVDELMDTQFFPNADKLAEILNEREAEREALRAIAKELAASNAFRDLGIDPEGNETCIFCARTPDRGHAEDCLVERAKRQVKPRR